MRTKDYFKVEAVKTALFLLVLFFVVNFITNYRLAENIEIYWDVAIIMTVANIVTLLVVWMVYGDKK